MVLPLHRPRSGIRRQILALHDHGGVPGRRLRSGRARQGEGPDNGAPAQQPHPIHHRTPGGAVAFQLGHHPGGPEQGEALRDTDRPRPVALRGSRDKAGPWRRQRYQVSRRARGHRVRPRSASAHAAPGFGKILPLSPDGEPMVRATSISRSFEGIQVLRNLDLHVQRGEFISIVGRSGAGKSTLLGIVGAQDTAFRGKLLIDGSDVEELDRRQLAALRRTTIGFVFQDFYLLPNLTALENVLLPAVFAGSDLEMATAQAREVLNHLSVRIDDTMTSVLSRGERQRVAVARGLVNRPQILLADEPSASLDDQSEKTLFNLLDELRAEQGFALVAVVHSGRVLERCDRVLELREGKLHEA
ncbi:ATP-binding cassette domain-containing protein [Candidatus Fermentibacteria bacterium]|nr:ATP-binding cassette domain-containing protein [Candidatus Fermentibacteria bacterium]